MSCSTQTASTVAASVVAGCVAWAGTSAMTEKSSSEDQQDDEVRFMFASSCPVAGRVLYSHSRS